MGVVVPPPWKKPRPSASPADACVAAVDAVSVWDVNGVVVPRQGCWYR